MSTVVRSYPESSDIRKLKLEPQALYLGLACISLCMFAIALTLSFPSIAEAVARLS
jgi:hypothetical protein